MNETLECDLEGLLHNLTNRLKANSGTWQLRVDANGQYTLRLFDTQNSDKGTVTATFIGQRGELNTTFAITWPGATR